MNNLLIKLEPEILLPYLAGTVMGNMLMKYETLLDCWIMDLDTIDEGKLVFTVLFNMLHKGKASGLTKTIYLYIDENYIKKRTITEIYNVPDDEYLYYYNLLKRHYPELFYI